MFPTWVTTSSPSSAAPATYVPNCAFDAFGYPVVPCCGSVVYVRLDPSVTFIAKGAFSKDARTGDDEQVAPSGDLCTNIKVVGAPGVLSVGDYAFSGLTQLTGFKGAKLQSIGIRAFDSTGITSMNFSILTSVGAHAFSNCYSLVNFTAPALVSIGKAAFYQNYALQTFAVGSALTTIEMDAFTYCTSLTSFNAPGLTTLGLDISSEVFGYCTSLASFTTGAGLTSVGACVFIGCTALKAFTAPGLTAIGAGAFAGGDLLDCTLVNVPSAIKPSIPCQGALGSPSAEPSTEPSPTPSVQPVVSPTLNPNAMTIAGNQLELNGDVPVYLIFYGDWSGTNSALYSNPGAVPIFENFVSGISSTSWWNIITATYPDASGYPQHNLALQKSSFVTKANYANFGINDVNTIIQDNINNGVIGPIVPGDNNIYVILPSDDISAALGWDCSNYCAQHYTGSIIIGGQSVNINSAVVVNTYASQNCLNGCNAFYPRSKLTNSPNGNLVADAMMSPLAHEIAEAVVNGHWLANAGANEIGDKCNTYFPTNSTILPSPVVTPAGGKAGVNIVVGSMQYLIQPLWANTAAGGCCTMTYPLPGGSLLGGCPYTDLWGNVCC